MINSKSNLNIVRWNDSKTVNLLSSYVGVEPVSHCLRFNKVEKKRVQVSCPKIVQEYNKFMGGVDLCDMFMALYRIDRRSKKYYLRIVYYLFTVCCSDAWIIHKINMKRLDKPVLSLREFCLSVSASLMKASKPTGHITPGRGRSRNITDTVDASSIPVDPQLFMLRKKRVALDVRYYGCGHEPSFHENTDKDKRKRCKESKTLCFCKKCNVPLCVFSKRNCFATFHKD